MTFLTGHDHKNMVLQLSHEVLICESFFLVHETKRC